MAGDDLWEKSPALAMLRDGMVGPVTQAMADVGATSATFDPRALRRAREADAVLDNLPEWSHEEAMEWLTDGLDKLWSPIERLMRSIHAFNIVGYLTDGEHSETLQRVASRFGLRWEAVRDAFRLYVARYPLRHDVDITYIPALGGRPAYRRHPECLDGELRIVPAKNPKTGEAEMMVLSGWHHLVEASGDPDGVEASVIVGMGDGDGGAVEWDPDHAMRVLKAQRSREHAEAIREAAKQGRLGGLIADSIRRGEVVLETEGGEVVDHTRVDHVEMGEVDWDSVDDDDPVPFVVVMQDGSRTAAKARHPQARIWAKLDSLTEQVQQGVAKHPELEPSAVELLNGLTSDLARIRKEASAHAIPMGFATPHFTCGFKGCRLRLNRVWDDQRGRRWVHGRAMRAMGLPDHEPIPVLDGLLPAKLVCDFCSELEPDMFLSTNNFDLTFGGGTQVASRSLDHAWATCPDCRALIEAGDIDAVTDRAVGVLLMGEDVPDAERQRVWKDLNGMHRQFVKNRTFNDRPTGA